ncbi:MAG: hypothetical protein J6Z36_01270, partial [Clostridia bacterium]|nr:hypothetical protein [Clostridia bacterium]
IREVSAQNFNVPLYMGEFTCYNNPEQWEGTLELLNESGWHWTSWTYKINAAYGAWGIYQVSPYAKKINAHTDSYEDILKAFSLLKTTEESKYRFSQNVTLYGIFQKYCKTTEKN